MFNLADIQAIRNAIENDTLTVFVGAGFSKFAETDAIKFPSWEELMLPFKKDLQTEETDYLKVAQLYAIEFGEYRLYEKLKDVIPLHASPSDLHIQLFRLNPKYVITTNFDNLLEKTINEQGLIYDIIKSDDDFVKSTLPPKLIKIHGDLDSHNIVFKEDDYLNYANNRPLLDNFLRHILSSTTVLFLGYSYSDNNVKQIAKWIEKQSKVSPPRFLVAKDENRGQIRYLEKHNIRIIFPNSNLGYRDLYEKFFNFIEKKELLVLENRIDIVDYFYNKIKHLDELNVLLPDYIDSLLPNITLEYHYGCFGLWFHQETMTMDYNIDIRRINIKFIEILEDIKDNNIKDSAIINKYLSILKLFIKANIIYLQYKNSEYINVYHIAYIIINKKINYTRYTGCNSYIFINDRLDYGQKSIIHIVNYYLNLKIIEENYNNFIEFSENMSKNLIYFILPKISKDKITFAEQLNQLISQNKRDKLFLKSMICHFNYNFLAIDIVRDFDLDNRIRGYYSDYLRSEQSELLFEKYPYKLRKKLESLLDFLNFHTIYKFYYDANIDNIKNIEQEKSNKSWGAKVNFHSEEQRSNIRLTQLLKFIANNEINIDAHDEFKNLMQAYITGRMEIFSINREFVLTKNDLFVCIKYFKLNDLEKIFSKNIFNLIKNKVDFKILFINDEKNYLLRTFDNLLDLFSKYPTNFKETLVSRSLCNCTLMLSLVNWSDRDTEDIVAKLLLLFKSNKNMPSDSYKALNFFILYHYRIYKSIRNRFSEILDIPLHKITDGIAHDYHFIKTSFENPFGYLDENQINYENVNLVKKAVTILKLSNSKDYQKKVVQDIIIKYLHISNQEIKKNLEKYIESLRDKNWNENKPYRLEDVRYEVVVNMWGLKINNDFINYLASNIDVIISESQDINTVSFAIESSEIVRLIKFMAETQNNEKYRMLYGKIKELKKS